MRAYASIWTKNLAIKTSKKTILASKCNYARSLIKRCGRFPLRDAFLFSASLTTVIISMNVVLLTPVNLLNSLDESFLTTSYFCINDQSQRIKMKTYTKKVTMDKEHFWAGAPARAWARNELRKKSNGWRHQKRRFFQQVDKTFSYN